jgi:protein tyrosine phosphatase (PTP) superfamily phosphohydrolase (DUF442 family)
MHRVNLKPDEEEPAQPTADARDSILWPPHMTANGRAMAGTEKEFTISYLVVILRGIGSRLK